MTNSEKFLETRFKKLYKVIIPYTESASPNKQFTIEYELSAVDKYAAQHEAETQFNLYCDSTSASWVRTMIKGGIRVWRIIEGLPKRPEEIDEMCHRLVETHDMTELCGILKQLALLEDASATSYLLAQMKNPNVLIASLALEALESIGDPTCFDAIRNLYKEDTPTELKIKIISAISKIALPEDNILDFLADVRQDTAPGVAEAAVKALNILEKRAGASGWASWLHVGLKSDDE